MIFYSIGILRDKVLTGQSIIIRHEPVNRYAFIIAIISEDKASFQPMFLLFLLLLSILLLFLTWITHSVSRIAGGMYGCVPFSEHLFHTCNDFGSCSGQFICQSASTRGSNYSLSRFSTRRIFSRAAERLLFLHCLFLMIVASSRSATLLRAYLKVGLTSTFPPRPMAPTNQIARKL